MWIGRSKTGTSSDCLPACDLLVDLRPVLSPPFVRGSRAALAGLAEAASKPFRIRSLFMPGVWGGTRLRELIPDLPEEWPNCAWGFEVVAPENTVTLQFDRGLDVVGFRYADSLSAGSGAWVTDTIVVTATSFRSVSTFSTPWTALTCRVRCTPTTPTLTPTFREPFAQTETYYIMEAQPEAKVYLGLTQQTSRERFLEDVARAVSDSVPFEISEHVNALPAEAGDLFLIPPGTVHCSGAGNLVLEISATPYIYTFKIYDYLRLDLDGKPRPISYHRAFEVIDFERTTDLVQEQLVARPQLLAEGPGWSRYLLADHPLLFHLIERVELAQAYQDTTESDGVHVLCVVEGPGVTLVSEHGEQPLHYAETAIVPARCGKYELRPWGPSKVVKCYLR